MTDTPRTDAAIQIQQAAPAAFSELATVSRAIERELAQEKVWKNEDPRMLRVQQRVSDVAFNYLHADHKAARQELETVHKLLATEMTRNRELLETMALGYHATEYRDGEGRMLWRRGE